VDEASNGRRYPSGIRKMVISLLQHGQQSPILVRPWPRDGRLKAVVFGFCRARAALEINEQRLSPKPFLLRYEETDLDERGAFLANVVENRDREDPSLIDHAYNIARLKDEFGMSQNQIAHELDVDKAWVSKTLRLLKLDASEQKLVDLHHRTNGEQGIAAATAYELAMIEDPSERKALLASILASPGAGSGPSAAAAMPAGKVKRATRSDLRAARERLPSSSGGQPPGKSRTAKEICLPFETACRNHDGPSGLVEKWCGDMVAYCRGRMSAAELIRRLRELASHHG
jgi:ParB/RepB/Spo0J family partition protein